MHYSIKKELINRRKKANANFKEVFLKIFSLKVKILSKVSVIVVKKNKAKNLCSYSLLVAFE